MQQPWVKTFFLLLCRMSPHYKSINLIITVLSVQLHHSLHLLCVEWNIYLFITSVKEDCSALSLWLILLLIIIMVLFINLWWITVITVVCLDHTLVQQILNKDSATHAITFPHATILTDVRHRSITAHLILLHCTLTLNWTCHLLFGPLMAVYS